MAKYLIDPIYAYKEIKDNFILYVKHDIKVLKKNVKSYYEQIKLRLVSLG